MRHAGHMGHMDPRMHYQWEMETKSGDVLRQYEEDGTENTWKQLNVDEVVRVSIIPMIPMLPRHDVFIDIAAGEKFIKRYATGFLRQRHQFRLSEYVNCVVTNRYKFWVLSDGRSMVTRNDYELNL